MGRNRNRKNKNKEKEDEEDVYEPSDDTLAQVVDGLKILPPTAPSPIKGSVPFSTIMADAGRGVGGANLPPEIVEAQEAFMTGLEDLLYYWKEFPLELPPSDLPEKDGKTVVSIESLFHTPNNNSRNELRSLAMGRGGRKKLNEEQKQELRKTGRFAIASEAFPGKNHIWQVAAWLQRGSDYYQGQQQQILIDLFNAVYGLPTQVATNVYEGVVGIASSVIRIPQVLFGFIDRKRKFSDSSIQQIYRDRLVKMLKEDLEHIPEGDSVSSWAGKKYRSRSTGEVYDFALHDQDLWNQISGILQKIENIVDREWKKKAVILRDTLESEREEKGDEATMYTDQEIEEIIQEERSKMLYSAVREKAGSIPVELLIRHFEAMEIVKAVTAKAQHELAVATQEAGKLLDAENPIRSQNHQWRSANVQAIVSKQEKMIDELPQVILEKLEKGGYKEQHYLLSKSLEFKAEHWDTIKADLASILVPKYSFELQRYYWSPTSWEIIRNTDGSYRAKKHTTYTVSSGYPFWKVINALIRVFTWTSNGALGLIVSAWCSPLSIRALLKLEPFCPYKKLDSKTGQLVTDQNTTVNPFFYLFCQIWKNVFESRDRFEREPDSGFLGKGVTRIFNVIWTYGLGVLGSVFLTVTYPTVILLNVALCLLLLGLAPIWGPAVAVLSYLFCLFVYDFDTNQIGAVLGWIYQIVWNLLKIGGSLVMLIVVPLVSVLVTLIRSLSNYTCSLSDWLFFHCVLRHLARLPDQNGFLIRRISGPGMRQEYCFQIAPEIAILALHSTLENKELDWYQSWVRLTSKVPAKHATRTLNSVFKPYGTISNKSLFEFYDKKETALAQRLSLLIEHRNRESPISPLSNNVRLHHYKIRQEPAAHRQTLQMATSLCENFYTRRLFPYLDKKGIEQFWFQKGLVPDSAPWDEIAKRALSELFGQGYLVPLEKEGEPEEDNAYRTETVFLEVQHPDAAKFASRVMTGNFIEPVKDVVTVTKYQNNKIRATPRAWKTSLTGISSFIPNSVVSSHASSLQFGELFANTTIDMVEITAKTPVLDGHGLEVKIRARQPLNFWIEEPTLTVEGAGIWDPLETICGSSVLTVAKMFLPLPIDSFLTVNKTYTTSSADYVLVIGTGVQGPYSRVKFRDATIYNMLRRLINEFKNPSFDLVISVENSSMGPMELFRIPVVCSEFLEVLQGTRLFLPLPSFNSSSSSSEKKEKKE